jgi:hypothetical protein
MKHWGSFYDKILLIGWIGIGYNNKTYLRTDTYCKRLAGF